MSYATYSYTPLKWTKTRVLAHACGQPSSQLLSTCPMCSIHSTRVTGFFPTWPTECAEARGDEGSSTSDQLHISRTGTKRWSQVLGWALARGSGVSTNQEAWKAGGVRPGSCASGKSWAVGTQESPENGSRKFWCLWPCSRGPAGKWGCHWKIAQSECQSLFGPPSCSHQTCVALSHPLLHICPLWI